MTSEGRLHVNRPNPLHKWFLCGALTKDGGLSVAKDILKTPALWSTQNIKVNFKQKKLFIVTAAEENEKIYFNKTKDLVYIIISSRD